MKNVLIAGALALALAAAACGGARTDQSAPAGGPTNASEAVYAAAGNVTAISGDRVTIAHGPVVGLGWPAMTMTFRAGDPTMVRGVHVGDRVTFRFRQSGNDYPLIALAKVP